MFPSLNLGFFWHLAPAFGDPGEFAAVLRRAPDGAHLQRCVEPRMWDGTTRAPRMAGGTTSKAAANTVDINPQPLTMDLEGGC